jgi:hypothetical protein
MARLAAPAASGFGKASASAAVTPPSRPESANVRIPAARLPGVAPRLRQPRSRPIKRPMPSATARREINSSMSMDGPATSPEPF